MADDALASFQKAKAKLEEVRDWVAKHPTDHSCAIRLQRAQADVKHWGRKLAEAQV